MQSITQAELTNTLEAWRVLETFISPNAKTRMSQPAGPPSLFGVARPSLQGPKHNILGVVPANGKLTGKTPSLA